MPLLPEIRTVEEFLESPRGEATYRPAVEVICRRHALPTTGLAKYESGSCIVFAVGGAYAIKLFEPIFRADAALEWAVLSHIGGRIGIPTPEPVATDSIEDWAYIVMGQLRGTSLRDSWNDIPPSERRRLCEELGAAIARLHRLPIEPLGLDKDAWAGFLAKQAETCVERQKAHGLAEDWLRQLPAFLDSLPFAEMVAAEPVLLHTEIMREHVFVEPERAGWAISGLLDFEPSMLGAPEYELASVGIFLARGEPGLLRAFLLGYGYPEEALTPALQRRILGYALLHRYSKLPWYLDLMPPRCARTLDELAGEWFAFE